MSFKICNTITIYFLVYLLMNSINIIFIKKNIKIHYYESILIDFNLIFCIYQLNLAHFLY
jgi:hypothetical protein